MEKTFRLFDFNIYNNNCQDDSNDEIQKDNNSFTIQMFGINETGKTCSIIVEEYKPFFYVKVGDDWNKTLKTSFLTHLKTKIGKFYENSIVECKLIKRKKLYGFDGGKEHKFIMLKFANINAFNRTKNLWYMNNVNENGEPERILIKNGYKFKDTDIELYEANIPPLLRFFHIREISPSGWIALPNSKTTELTCQANKTTTCTYEFLIDYNHIIPLNNKETRVPYKIMSFDIEASSSHGDFPVPVKSYKKLATNIVDYFTKFSLKDKNTLINILKSAFGFEKMINIDLVYPKEPVKTLVELEEKIDLWLKTKVRDYSRKFEEHSIEKMFESMHKEYHSKNDTKEADDGEDTDSDNEDENKDENKDLEQKNYKKDNIIPVKNKQATILDIMQDDKIEREIKINELILSLRACFPALEGDKVTFIGSTFLNYGDTDPYLNHCIVLNSCDKLVQQNSEIETYSTEKDVLLAWKNLVQKENPDIIIGYNIFSFDYEFMFRRSQECECEEEFLKLSRNKEEICATKDFHTKKYQIDKSSITLASGTYDLSIIKMTGRLQIDMYNWFRRTENLSSYKLDYVGGYFIGDDVKGLEPLLENGSKVTRIKTNNMT
jgi:DNA polymerase elongation subunit (family B)